MKSPQNMKIIVIDITNACINSCSNCTRFCGHHKKPFFMDFETFKKAVDSLDEYQGIVGIIGGEPTLHPRFEEFVEYIRERRIKKICKVSREPITDMNVHIHSTLINETSKIGLWSVLNATYYKHFEIINDTFELQYLNDHNNTCLHQALLMSRNELGIKDEEWIEKRNKCWIQNTWSATITPKGCFFCEVAGALDMLFNGPGGWPIESDWWKREPKDFADQLHWCEICSGCLDVPQRISSDGRDDLTPGMHKKLIEIKSPKVLSGNCVVHDINKFDKSLYKSFAGNNDYMEAANNIRTSKKNKIIYPKKFDIVKSLGLRDFIKKNKAKDWIIVSDNALQGKILARLLSKYIINPGCVYKLRDILVFNILAKSIRNEKMNLSKPILEYYPCDKIIDITELINNEHKMHILFPPPKKKKKLINIIKMLIKRILLYRWKY